MEKERYSKMQGVFEMNPPYNLSEKLLLQSLLSLSIRVCVVPVDGYVFLFILYLPLKEDTSNYNNHFKIRYSRMYLLL